MSINPTLSIMQKTAIKAGKSLLRDFSEVNQLQVSKKGPADFVSISDKRSEEIIKNDLMYARPDYAFLGEESGSNNIDSPHRFVVDPLDGTTNFLHGLPHWAIHISYQYMGETQLCVTYDPIKDELFYAEKGSGAYLNNQRLRVSARKKLSESVLATGIPFLGINENKHEEYLKRLSRVMAKTAGVRRFGAATLDLAYVASGRYEGFFEYGLNPWDIEGGILMIREAGGFVFDEKNRTYKCEGNEQQSKWIIASNNELQDDIFQLLNSY
ncbi:MAG: inositol monophosphatase family protein [Alphaproteobacteria bacterium]|nr:inositol monophosphatase family protein [Alphaproteobacteria bacterium]